MLGCFRANAIQRFTVSRIRLASDVIGNTSFGHKIAFVGGIDKHLRPINGAIVRAELGDARAILLHGLQTLIEQHANVRFLQPLLINRAGDLRFKGPHGGVCAVEF